MRENGITKIVVGTDFNLLATAALRFAGGIAARAGAELIVVYADTFDAPAEFTAAQVQHIAEAIERSKNRTREQLQAYVKKQVPKEVRWRAVVAEGMPATAMSLVAEAEEADFIALGTHGRGGLQRLVMGSVAEAVIREAHVPVLTVRVPEPPRDVRRVLCPVNGGEAAAAASQATHIAGALGAELKLLQVSSDEEEILRVTDSGDYDLLVIGREHKRLTRHASIPVLTVTRPIG
jgi:nucleotide-binding universal stress UspA family protein